MKQQKRNTKTNVEVDANYEGIALKCRGDFNRPHSEGITLISLVITIVIMLILVGATLSINVNQGSLFGHAENASEKWNAKVDEEQIEINEALGWLPPSFEQTTDTDATTIAQKADAENTYLIQSIEDLVVLSKAVNEGTTTYEGKIFELERNLSFTDEKSYIDPDATSWGDINGNGTEEKLITELTTGNGFTPIGISYSCLFKGTIEGNGKTIDGLYVQNRTNVGFVGYAQNATIKNLNMSKVNLNGSYVGGLIGYCEGTLTLENNTCSGTIVGTRDSGGLVGELQSATGGVVISGCSNYVEVSGNRVAGIVAYVYGSSDEDLTVTIDSCYNFGDIQGKGETAGFVGYLYDVQKTTIIDSYNEGTISGNGNYCAGFIGYARENIEISRCHNTGDINAGLGYTGGLVGTLAGSSSNLTIEKSYNEGDISSASSSPSCIGGIIGQNSSSGNTLTIENCYNKGDLNLTGGSSIGGISGNYATTIRNCFNEGNITGSSTVGRYNWRSKFRGVDD